MPLNQTWLARLPKTTECQAGDECQADELEIPKSLVVVRARIERHRVAWHPECWLVIFIPMMEAKPFNVNGPGRQPLDLDNKDRRERKLIQNKDASYTQRVKAYQMRMRYDADKGMPTTVLRKRVEILMTNQDLLWWEIQHYGGAPDGWRIPEGGEDYLKQTAEAKADGIR